MVSVSGIFNEIKETLLETAIEEGQVEMFLKILPDYMKKHGSSPERRHYPLFWLADNALKLDQDVAIKMLRALLEYEIDPNFYDPRRSERDRTALSYMTAMSCPPVKVAAYLRNSRVHKMDVCEGREIYRDVPAFYSHPKLIKGFMLAGADPDRAQIAHLYGPMTEWKLDHIRTLGDAFREMHIVPRLKAPQVDKHDALAEIAQRGKALINRARMF